MSDKNRVLVVGGAGYIGSHCCKALADAGYRPVCFDNFSTGHRGFVKWGPVIEGDIRDQSHLADSIKQHGVTAVLHFAASSLVAESVSDPEKYYRNNVEGTLSLLRAMRQTQCKTLVFSSSGAVYGESHQGLICESELPKPVNPYGRTKLIIEEMLADFQKAYALAPVCLRYFNASGADLSGEIGEDHDPETHLIPRALLAVQGEVDDFAIYGDDYDTPDGTAIRDYIHVMDLAHAHILALKYLVSGEAGGCFNLGTGRGHSVKQILRQIRTETGRNPSFAIKARRHGDPPVLVADPARAKAVLGFAPKYSDLSTIVCSAWKWHQSFRCAKASEARQTVLSRF
ncbi:UDP-glucose-4-epimerase GalE [Bradyrhizobium sp. AZCC 1610]|uniref:UDP-glucose 4-epimerase GalE n=1 Tax=Bradyrhizobium sp. AZCC 1610 TaxID=3117020 RepID=UPI002FEE7805